MAIVAPFKGLTYNLKKKQNLSRLMAPPYDVISQKEQVALYQADPHNVVRLILGEKKTGDSDWDNRYTRAADDFQRWQSNGALIRAKEPSFYLTAMTYRPGNGDPERVRWGIILLVKIEDPDSGVVLPHERTFSAHKDDRLKLFRTCNAQFSQIFGLYEDPENAILEECQKFSDPSPRMDFELPDGARHRMWIISRARLFEKVSDLMQNKSIFIADGHHRYETARNFRNIMRARFGEKPVNRSYEYVMMYLSNMNDAGLTILPSHRLVKMDSKFDPENMLKKAAHWFEIQQFSRNHKNIKEEASELKRLIKENGTERTAIGFYHNQSDQWRLLCLRPGMEQEIGEDLHPSLRNLDVLVLSRLILQKCLGLTPKDLDNEDIIRYESNISTTMQAVDSGEYQMAFLLNHTRMDQVKDVARNSLVMPRKSTYFFPKVLTGMVFNKIDPHEIIHAP